MCKAYLVDETKQIEDEERAKLAEALGMKPTASTFAIVLSIITTTISFFKGNPQVLDLIKRLLPNLFPANGDGGPVAQ